MKRLGEWAIPFAAGVGLLIAATGPAYGTSDYGKAEKKACSFCHVGKTADKVFTEAGKFYSKHHTLKDFGDEAKEPKAPAKAATSPAPAPASASEAPAAATAEASAANCPCGCPHCHKECPEDCPHRQGMGERHPPMEKMGGHLEEMRKAVSDLKESEKKMESTKEPEAFRAAVLEHLKKLDDLVESRLRHMEKMMGAWHHGMPGPAHRHCR